jgi:hypothetical protein
MDPTAVLDIVITVIIVIVVTLVTSKRQSSSTPKEKSFSDKLKELPKLIQRIVSDVQISHQLKATIITLVTKFFNPLRIDKLNDKEILILFDELRRVLAEVK